MVSTERRRQEEKEARGLVWGVGHRKFEIHLIDTLQQQRLQTNISILIVDSEVFLVCEKKTYNKK